jgi:hypothetical protein
MSARRITHAVATQRTTVVCPTHPKPSATQQSTTHPSCCRELERTFANDVGSTTAVPANPQKPPSRYGALQACILRETLARPEDEASVVYKRPDSSPSIQLGARDSRESIAAMPRRAASCNQLISYKKFSAPLIPFLCWPRCSPQAEQGVGIKIYLQLRSSS